MNVLRENAAKIINMMKCRTEDKSHSSIIEATHGVTDFCLITFLSLVNIGLCWKIWGFLKDCATRWEWEGSGRTWEYSPNVGMCPLNPSYLVLCDKAKHTGRTDLLAMIRWLVSCLVLVPVPCRLVVQLRAIISRFQSTLSPVQRKLNERQLEVPWHSS